MVLDAGDGVTHAVPIYEGFAMPHSVMRADVAGRDVTRYLQLLLRKEGHHFHTSAEFEVVRTIKEVGIVIKLVYCFQLLIFYSCVFLSKLRLWHITLSQLGGSLCRWVINNKIFVLGFLTIYKKTLHLKLCMQRAYGMRLSVNIYFNKLIVMLIQFVHLLL